MNGKNQHVVPTDVGWGVRGEGNKRLTFVNRTKEEAIKKARVLAMKNKSELVIHNKDGTISDKDSFGNDPHPPGDKKH